MARDGNDFILQPWRVPWSMQEVRTDLAPQSSSPLSQAIMTEERVFVSGQVPVDPDTGEIVAGDITAQTRQVIENIEAVLVAADASLSDVVKTSVFLTDMGDFAGMNEVYETMMHEPFPSRSAIGVAALASDIRVEIEAIAER